MLGNLLGLSRTYASLTMGEQQLVAADRARRLTENFAADQANMLAQLERLASEADIKTRARRWRERKARARDGEAA